MPPKIDLEPFRDDITKFIKELHWDHPKVRQWLERSQGIIVSSATLQRHLTSMGIARRGESSANDHDLIDAISHQFHTSLRGDEAIAKSLNTQGFSTTARQVKEIRLKLGSRTAPHPE
jgi:hypothetical protein